MKKAIEIYKEETYYCNYEPMLEEFAKIIVKVDDTDYQGDSRVLYKDKDRYGWLQFGWGSCSGCDALQGCDGIEEVQILMDELYASIKWFDNAKESLQFFKDHDWEGDYSWNIKEQKDFVNKVIEYLEKAI